jgi:hypothetical protein
MKKRQPYPASIEAQMQNVYHSLSEKDRRRYAAIEALKLGYGGISYICRLMECNEVSVKHGMRELEHPLSNINSQIRQPGAGRKKRVETMVGLDEAFLHVMDNHTAGSPMDNRVKWSNLSRPAIAEKLAEAGFKVSVTVVDQLLENHGYRRRQAFKAEAGKQVAQRNEQFQNISQLKAVSHEQGNPVMSMDVKKRIDR